MRTFKVKYMNRKDGHLRITKLKAQTWVDAVREAYSAKYKTSDEDLTSIELAYKGRVVCDEDGGNKKRDWYTTFDDVADKKAQDLGMDHAGGYYD